jgi:hypothetical protein
LDQIDSKREKEIGHRERMIGGKKNREMICKITIKSCGRVEEK